MAAGDRDLDGIKTGTVMAKARQGSEYNSFMPTLRDGEPHDG